MKLFKQLLSRLTKTHDKKILVENFFSIFSFQMMGYVFPLITLPYLVRVLGPNKFGLIAFANAIIQYFAIVTDYGFNLSATRDISINRENVKKIAEIFNSVMVIKSIFFLLSFLILFCLILCIPKLSKDYLIYIYSFGAVLGNVLFPLWFFQGTERMKYIPALNFIGKLFFTLSIFILIKKQADFIYVPLLTSLGGVIPGVMALYIVRYKFKVRFAFPAFKNIHAQLKEGWHIFISSVASSLYTTSNMVILGFFANDTIVGYYAAAEKIVNTVQRLVGPVSQAIYPYVSKLASQSKENALRFLRKIIIIIGGGTFVLSLGLFIFASPIVGIMLGEEFRESIIVLRILAFLPFIIGLSNILGIQTMLTFDMKKEFSKILLFAAGINIILGVLLASVFKHIGISIAVLITEIFVTGYMFFSLTKNRLLTYTYILKGCYGGKE